MAIELKLYKTDDDVRTVKRDDANLIEMEKFFELQDEISKGHGMNEKNEVQQLSRIEQNKKTIKYLAFLFKEQGVTEEDLMKGIKAKEFDKVAENIFRQISPSDYERLDRIRAIREAEQKAKLNGNKK